MSMNIAGWFRSIYRNYLPYSLRRRLGLRRIVPASRSHGCADSAVEYPKVTIIVTAFNDADYLEMCLESVRLQDYPNLECLVVDDCSDDCSQDIANLFCARDQRFSILQLASNSGVSFARNSGVEASTGEFISFLDADDFLYLGSVSERMKPLLVANPKHVAGSWCKVEHVSESASVIPGTRPAEGMTRRDYVALAGDCPFGVHAPVFTRQSFLHAGRFNEALSNAADWEFWQRMMRVGYVFLSAACVGAGYRQKTSSFMKNFIERHYLTSMAVIDDAYAEAPDSWRFEGGFYKAWSHYKRLQVLGPRAVSSLAIAVMKGQQTDSILASFDVHDWGVIQCLCDVRARVAYAVRRVHGLGEDQVGAKTACIEKDIERVCSTLHELLPPKQWPLAAPETG